MNQMNKLILLALLMVTAIDAERFVNLAYSSKSGYENNVLVQAPTCPGPNSYTKCEGLSNRYRTLDGTCNNLKYPWWGAVQTPYNRLVKPFQTCNSTAPRTDTLLDLAGLKSALDVTKGLLQMEGINEGAKENEFFAFFSVFVGHDLSSTVPAYVECECGSSEHECFNIQLSSLDQDEFDRNCLNFVRSLDSREAFDCGFDHREQLSNVSHYLDLSNIYGSNEAQSRLFRAYTDGKLKMNLIEDSLTSDSVSSLPILDINKCLTESKRTDGCFYGPDNRAFIEPLLTGIYTMFVREHNRIATNLKLVNTHWSDSTLFQESRRLLVAIYQNMVYSEFLPIVIGEDKVKDYQLKPLTSGHGYFYNDQLYVNIYNEFATAAFKLINYIPEINGPHKLTACFWSQSKSYAYLEDVLMVLVNGPSLGGGYAVSKSLNVLFPESPNSAIDTMYSLPAFIVQQGRDHTLESYTTYRNLANGGHADAFSDFSNIDESVIEKLKLAYNNVPDIDLFMGLLAEDKMTGAAVGKTQAFIIGKQFNMLKFGDRFYFENGEDTVNRFTADQLNSIRAYKSSKFLCNNVANKDSSVIFTNKGFLVNNMGNPKIDCEDLPDIDFDLWKERSTYY